jgi:hypothetical protein
MAGSFGPVGHRKMLPCCTPKGGVQQNVQRIGVSRQRVATKIKHPRGFPDGFSFGVAECCLRCCNTVLHKLLQAYAPVFTRSRRPLPLSSVHPHCGDRDAGFPEPVDPVIE